MKRLAAWLLALWLLTGCSGTEDGLERAMKIRQMLLCTDCCFTAAITADYGDKLHSFAMQCEADASGTLNFTVTQPETIAGITGTIDAEGGKLTFDDTALYFPLLADDQITPVSAPWIFLRTLKGGYIHAAGEEGDALRVSIYDSYEQDALTIDVWLDENNLPQCAEISYGGYTIVSMTIENFVIG